MGWTTPSSARSQATVAKMPHDVESEDVDWLREMGCAGTPAPTKDLDADAFFADAAEHVAAGLGEDAADILCDIERGLEEIMGEGSIDDDIDAEAAHEDVSGEEDESPAASSGGGASVVDDGARVPTAANVLTSLRHVRSSNEVCELLPFLVTRSWDVVPVGPPGGNRLGKIRMIDGRCLKADCSTHTRGKTRCSLTLDTGSAFHAIEALLVKWLIFGTTCDVSGHADSSAGVKVEGKALARSSGL